MPELTLGLDAMSAGDPTWLLWHDNVNPTPSALISPLKIFNFIIFPVNPQISASPITCMNVAKKEIRPSKHKVYRSLRVNETILFQNTGYIVNALKKSM